MKNFESPNIVSKNDRGPVNNDDTVAVLGSAVDTAEQTPPPKIAERVVEKNLDHGALSPESEKVISKLVNEYSMEYQSLKDPQKVLDIMFTISTEYRAAKDFQKAKEWLLRAETFQDSKVFRERDRMLTPDLDSPEMKN